MAIKPTLYTPATLPKVPFSILIYGMPKVGKTVFVSGAPKPLLISVDIDGEISLRNHNDLADVTVVKARTFEKVVDTLQWLDDNRPDEYETIIIDTLTALQEGQRMEMVNTQDVLTKDKWVFNQSIYSVNNFKIMAIADLCMKLKSKYNIILTCHLKEEIIGTEQNRRVRERPTLSPSLLQQVYACINGIFCLEATGDNRILTVKGSKLLMANSRYNIPVPYISQPTFPKLLKYLN